MTTADNIDRVPVRRYSRPRGTEGMFWQRTNRKDVRRILLAARRFDLVTRKPGRRNGDLGHVAREVLEYFINLVGFRTGQLDPSIQTIMGKVRRSRAAVVEALKALRRHGFIDWLRRYIPTGNTGKGPQVQQTSNAYRLLMPARALRLLPGMGQPAPVPDDYSTILEARREALDEHRASLPLDQRTLFDVEDDELAQSLVRLARGVMQQREFTERTEPQAD